MGEGDTILPVTPTPSLHSLMYVFCLAASAISSEDPSVLGTVRSAHYKDLIGDSMGDGFGRGMDST